MSTLQMISDHLMNNTLDMAAKYARLRARAAGESRAVTAGDVAVALDRFVTFSYLLLVLLFISSAYALRVSLSLTF